MADLEKGGADKIPLVNAVEVTPVAGSTVEVVAPMDLQEGYQLQVQVNGVRKSVNVPSGGVKQGESFQAQPYDDNAPTHHIPVGQWRDNICDCLKFGCCHPMCCMGYWCEPILAGQVMTRMSRDWLGGPGPRPSVSNTCQIVTGIWVFVLLVQSIMRIIAESQGFCIGGELEFDIDTNQYKIKCPDGTFESPNTTYKAVMGVAGTLGGVFTLYLFFSICRTRQAMRRKYNIEAGGLGDGCEDCCCAFFCSCCTIQQMARHTNDYSTHDIGCCSNECFNNRGQQDHLPEIEP
ncbi:expressed unknown protein [Seminavis robusta]|uniref:PLAC8 family protein n=1 Tax=Seminavis robusta TaxID=568900 RepID=A0A9N8DCX2_9STRA|nr:expressed unknown protein [Seminavis robusta]|eukprot:Sro38_g023520.1 n/a (291) ;mRNA; r:3190-4232